MTGYFRYEYDEKLVLRYFMEDEFKQIPKEKIDEIVCVNKEEENILKTWEQHFQRQNVPYAVIKTGSKKHQAFRIFKEFYV